MLNLVTVPPRLLLRALDDLHTIALAAARLETVEQRLDDRMGAAIALGERIEEVMVDAIDLAREIRDIGDRVAGLGTDVDGRLERVVALGGRLEERAGEVIALGDQIVALGDRVDAHVAAFDAHAEAILARTAEVEEAARDVALSGRQLADALPTLQRAVQMAEPLEGAVERLGRIVDRLPGGSVSRSRGG